MFYVQVDCVHVFVCDKFKCLVLSCVCSEESFSSRFPNSSPKQRYNKDPDVIMFMCLYVNTDSGLCCSHGFL